MGLIRRREDIQSLAVAISDDAIICGIRPNGVPERDPISPSIVEVEFVPAATLRGAVERAETAETEVARLRGIIERRGTVEQLAQLDHPGGQ